MPTFDYSAYNDAGKLINGVVSADSERQARRVLKDRGLLPSSLVELGDKGTGKRRIGLEARVNNFDLSLLLHQQAILIQSGLPLEEALRMTIAQAETAGQRRMVESWRSEIIEGRSFSDALRRSPYKIPESIIAGVGVGEESGHLHRVLLRLAEDLETSAENKKTITRAMIYPAFLVGFSVVVVTIMMAVVVPKITAIVITSKRELPLITQAVVALSDFVQSYGLVLLLLAIVLTLGFRYAMRDPARKERWHELMLSMPGLGRWIRMGSIADWARSLGVLLSNGVPALAALSISATVVSNLHLQRKFESVTEGMRQGSSLQKALEDSQLGSGFLVHMVGSGEASSELDKMLLRVSEYYSVRLKNAVEIFMALFTPIMVILMGMMILAVVAAVMLPILDMNNMI
jgi:general secretion pathway protein F